MAISTYHKKKLYIPKEIENTLELTDGDRAEIQVLDKKSFKVSLVRREPQMMSAVEKRLMEGIIETPFSGKLSRQHFRRQDYYEED